MVIFEEREMKKKFLKILKMMLIFNGIILIFFPHAHNFSEPIKNLLFSLTLLGFTSTLIFFIFGALYFMKVNSSGDNSKKHEDNILETKKDSIEYHNDFTKVGSGPKDTNVKPIDYTGNWVENLNKTFEEDMKKLKENKDMP